MDPHPDDLTGSDDLTLMQAARSGDRLAFGVLYLRHHAAAWRIACVASRFSPDAELAVIEGFTRVFSALPAGSEELAAGGVTFRPYLLACVRQAALDRARTAGRAEPGSTRATRRSGHPPASPPPPAPLAGLAPDGEVVLSSLEHHVARGALAELPERSRTALWLSDVEAMTPGEVAGIMGSSPEVVASLAESARSDMRAAREVAHGRHEVRADCRFTVDHLGAYRAATLDPKRGVLVRSHLDLCPPCRMRLGELADAPAALAAAVPAAPLLGGEAQHHWLTSAAEAHPAERLLPPGLAATSPFRRIPEVLHRGQDRRTHRLAVAAGRLPRPVRAGRITSPTLPAVSAVMLVVAWLAVMLAIPQLMQPETAPGPEGLALPAVQAYVPSYLPGAAPHGSIAHSNSAHPSRAPIGGGDSELAAQLTSDDGRAAVGSLGQDGGEPAAQLISTVPPSRATGRSRPGGGAAAPKSAGLVGTVPAIATASVPVAPLPVATPPAAPGPTQPVIDQSVQPPKRSKPKKDAKPDKKSKPGKDATRDRKSRAKIVTA